MFVERLSWKRQMDEDNPTPSYSVGSVLGAQMKLIAAMVKGLLEQALKNHVRVQQVKIVRGLLYFRSR